LLTLVQTVIVLYVQGQPAPTITANINPITCGQSTILTVNAPGATGYVWTANPGGPFTGNGIVTVSPLTTTNYSVTITGGTFSGQSASITITESSIPIPSITGSATVCAGDIGEIYNILPTTNDIFWSVIGGGFSGQFTNQITIDWGPSGAGSLTVTLTNPISGCYKNATKYVTIDPLPDATFLTPLLLGWGCGGRYKLTANNQSYPASAYSWNFNDGSPPATGKVVYHRFLAFGCGTESLILF
jgi:hypothetical protein